MTKQVKRILALSTCIIVAVFIFVWLLFLRKTKDDYEREITFITTEGLNNLSPDGEKLLQTILKNSEDYIPVLERSVVFPADLRQLLSISRPRLIVSLQILIRINNEKSLLAIDNLQRKTLDYLQVEWKGRNMNGLNTPVATHLLWIQHAILHEYGKTKSQRNVPTAAWLIQQADYSTALSALDYLLKVGRGDTSVIKLASASIKTKSSSMYKSPIAEAYIRELSKTKTSAK